MTWSLRNVGNYVSKQIYEWVLDPLCFQLFGAPSSPVAKMKKVVGLIATYIRGAKAIS
jgi:hypothetical protein